MPGSQPARRPATALVVAVVVLVVAGSLLAVVRGGADDTVLTVDDWSLGRAELRDELDQIAANDGYRAARARGGQPLPVFRAGSTTEYDPALVAELLNERVTFQLAAAEVARRGLVATPEDREAALAVIEDGLATGAPPTGAAPPGTGPQGSAPVSGRAVLDAFGSYREVLITGVVNLQLLQRALGLGTGVSLDDATRVAWEQTRDRIALQSCVRHVLVRVPTGQDDAAARDRALGLESRLRAGEDIATLAADASDDTSSKARGGDLGCAPRGRYEGAFEDAVWNQPVGAVGSPVRSEFGYHLIVVTERRERTYEELLPDLRAAVQDQGREKLQAWLRDATRAASVTVDPGVGRWNASTGLVEPPEGAATMTLVPGMQGTVPAPPAAPGGTR